MRSVIQQSIILPASRETLFEMYVTADQHSAFTGSPVKIGAESGATFSAFDGALSGTMLVTIKPTLVVQSWRSTNFTENDRDSTLILQFKSLGENKGQIDLVHVDVPSQDYDGVTNGWEKYYWTPWRNFLLANKS